MKRAPLLLLVLAICLAGIISTGQTAGSAADFDAILKKYVHGDYFDYSGLSRSKADMAALDGFLAWQGSVDISKWPEADQIAFYINAYNACCIKAILDHYPVHTPNDVAGFFTDVKFPVAGESLSISQIEYDRLIGRYKDMRAHFAVVCADRGCLPLKPAAYTGATLDADLEQGCRAMLADTRRFKVDKEKNEIWISKLFEWYGPKFTMDPKRPAEKPEAYMKYWASEDVKNMLASGNYTLRIIEWDWTLNEKLGKN